MTDDGTTGRLPAEQAANALRRHVLQPLLERCVDETYGGFLVDFDERWEPVGPHDKSLEHATRTTISFALLDRAMPGEGCDRLVRHGCAFLKEVMWDREHGGFYARVDRSGQPLWDGLKHPHATNYAARAFQMSEPYLPPGEGEAWAERALTWLDDVAWDESYGGYWGSYRRDNELYPAGSRLPTPDGRDIFGLPAGFKEINTLGDAIEMLTSLLERGSGSRSADRLTWMVDLVCDRLIDPDGLLPYSYRRDWRPAPDLLRVGYQFMMARHLATVPSSSRPIERLIRQCCQLVDFCLTSARHPRGGFCFAVSAHGRSWPATGPATDVRQWWVQFEAAYTLHFLGRHTSVEPERRTRYRAAFEEQWTFVRTHFFDARHGGVREEPEVASAPRRFKAPRRRSAPDARETIPLKSHPWKDASHEVGTLLEIAGIP
jgi:mannobiose 2-epimerase